MHVVRVKFPTRNLARTISRYTTGYQDVIARDIVAVIQGISHSSCGADHATLDLNASSSK